MTTTAPILVAEDEESDVLILDLAIKQAGLLQPLVAVPDGVQAVAYLEGSPPYQDRAEHPLPALLLLDLKMPRMTGFDVLAWVATRPELKRLPVVVLSSSCWDSDKSKALELGASDYHIKPTGLPDFIQLLKDLEKRWLR